MQQHRPARRQWPFAVNAALLGARQYGAGTMQGVTPPLLPCSSDRPSGTVFYNSTKFSVHAVNLLTCSFRPREASEELLFFLSLLCIVSSLRLPLHVTMSCCIMHAFLALLNKAIRLIFAHILRWKSMYAVIEVKT